MTKRSKGTTKGGPTTPVINLRTVGEITFLRLDGTTHTVAAGAQDQMLDEEAARP